MKLRTFHDCMVNADKRVSWQIMCIALRYTHFAVMIFNMNRALFEGWKFVEEIGPKYARGLKISVALCSCTLCCYVSVS